MKFFLRLFAVLGIACIGLYGCSTNNGNYAGNNNSQQDKGYAQGMKIENNQGYVSTNGKYALFNNRGVINKKVINFDFDSNQVDTRYLSLLAEYGKYLSSHPASYVRIEGHTDERGSREYNIALGERRAKALRDILLADGATNKQVTIVSYGEELPVDRGHYENAWHKNRRGEIVYLHK